MLNATAYDIGRAMQTLNDHMVDANEAGVDELRIRRSNHGIQVTAIVDTRELGWCEDPDADAAIWGAIEDAKRSIARGKEHYRELAMEARRAP